MTPDLRALSERIPHWFRPYTALLGVLALALIVRLLAADRSWFWYDEFYSATFAFASDLNGTLEYIQTVDYHPPLYYQQLRAWGSGGSSERWLLGNSVLWGCFGTAGAFAFGKRFGGRFGGLVCGLFVALHPLSVEQSSELRMYSMVLALSAWAAYFTFSQLVSERPWPWAAGALVSALALCWSHGAGVLWLGIAGAITLFMMLFKAETHSGLRSAVLTLAVSGAGAFPVLRRAFDRHPGHLRDSESARWLEILAEVLGVPEKGFTLVAALMLLVVVVSSIRRGRDVPVLPALLMVLSASWLGLYLIGQRMPVVHLRAVMPVAQLTLLTLGLAVSQLMEDAPRPERALAWGSGTAVALLFLASTWKLMTEPERAANPHAAIVEVGKQLKPGESIWAPRGGNAFAVCWELGGPGEVHNPMARTPCRLEGGARVFSGSRRPRALSAPFWLLQRDNERAPRLKRKERGRKVKGGRGMRVTHVMARSKK